jgi:HSP20 family protein
MCPTDDDFIRDIRHLQETMERLLADFSRLRMPLMLGKETVWRPLTDVYETEDEFIVRMEIAGMEAGDFSVTLDNRILILRGVRRDPAPPAKRHFHKMEITVGPFERIIEVPPHIQIASAEAHYENGFLMVRVQKGVAATEQEELIIPVERGL